MSTSQGVPIILLVVWRARIIQQLVGLLRTELVGKLLTIHLGWIGGRVVVDARTYLGFYFDSNITFGAEVTAEWLHTGLAGT